MSDLHGSDEFEENELDRVWLRERISEFNIAILKSTLEKKSA